MERKGSSFIRDGKLCLYGYYGRCVWRDEKTGGSCFFVSTEDRPVLQGMRRGERLEFSPSLGRDEYAYSVYVSARDASVPLFEEHMPVMLTGLYEESSPGVFDFVAEKAELTAGRPHMTANFLAWRFGISGEQAEEIVSGLGDDVFAGSRRADAPEAVRTGAGLSARKARAVVAALRKIEEERAVFSRLAPFGASCGSARKAMGIYGDEAYEKIAERPWKRGLKCGLTFAQCDAIAFANGKRPDDPERTGAIAAAAVEEISGAGHVWCDAEAFFRAFRRLSGGKYCPASVCGSEGEAFRYARMGRRDVVLFKKIIRAEWRIAANVKRLSGERKAYAPKGSWMAFDAGSLSGGQKQALRLVETSGVKVLTGGPGVGKTTATREIVRYFTEIAPGARVKLAAPTGRAAQRLSESCGMPASTVHQLLEYRPYGDECLCRNRGNPVEADMIVVDEMSMMNIELFDLLLDAVSGGSVLLLVGDVDQLEPIGPGAVFRDLIRSGGGRAECETLTEVFRQGADSLIVQNASRINRGNARLAEGPDFGIVRAGDPQEALEAVTGIIRASHDPADPFGTQVLCPARKGDAGVLNLNRVLQEMLNPKPAKEKVFYGETSYGVGDKILMTVNNYPSGYFNGDIGTVTGVGRDSLEVELRGEGFSIPRCDLSEMSLAYAMTIHKSQGSEFGTVVISLPLDTPGMLVKSLLYTAVTRAKKKVVIVSEGDALERAVATPAPARNTLLGTMLAKDETEMPPWLLELKGE